MATVASINVGLNAYTNQFDTAINKSSKTVRDFQATASAGTGKIGQQIQAAGFAFQDFTSVLQNGGKGALGRAFGSISNNIGQITAGFGPWGAVIGTVAGALAGVLIPRLLDTASAADEVRESMDKAFEKSIKTATTDAQFTRKIGGMDSKGAKSVAEDLAAEAVDLRAELDARRQKFAREITGMVGRGEIQAKFIDSESPVLKGQGKNGTNIDFNQAEWISTSDVATERINAQRDKLEELDAQLTKVRQHMGEATKAGRWQEMQEDVQKGLDAWNEFNDAIKNHEELLARQKTNERLDMQSRVLGRLQSETGTTRAGTGAAGFGTSEAYSAIAAATRVNGKQDIQTLIEIEKRKEAEDKKLRKAVEDGFAKSAATIVSMN